MPNGNITGRDEEIIAQALATAYAVIGTLPEHCRENSNHHDMSLLLKHCYGGDWKARAQLFRHVLSEAEWNDGKRPLGEDLFSDDLA